MKLFTKKTSWTLLCLVINLILILAVACPNKTSIIEPFLLFSHYLSLPLPLPLPLLSTQLLSSPLFLSFKFPSFILTPYVFVSFSPNICPVSVFQNLFCPLSSYKKKVSLSSTFIHLSSFRSLGSLFLSFITSYLLLNLFLCLLLPPPSLLLSLFSAHHMYLSILVRTVAREGG